MNYELAKQLKDTGFPQVIKRPEEDYQKDNQTQEVVVIPTLSQLIEACGDELLKIEHVLDGGLHGEEKLWWASSKNHGMAGTTIEEAVANLWLRLNGK